MDDVLLQIVLERLDKAKLLDEVESLVLAACGGAEQLAASLGGKKDIRAAIERAGEVAEGPGAYLGSVRVEGFRGIGAEAILELTPGPGLTLILGRNGSGKSSFAEALELLLTKDSQRWSTRSAVWKDGWRNVHHTDPVRIQADLVVDGQAGVTKVTRAWQPESSLDQSMVSVQRTGEPRADLAALGWEQLLVRYRPFLSYNELGAMFDDGPTKLYDVLALVLGLEELTQAEKALKDARLERKRILEAATAELEQLRAALQFSDDERAAPCLAALAGRTWQLDTVRTVLAGDPSGAASEAGSLVALRQLVSLAVPSETAVAEAAGGLRDAAERLAALDGTGADQAHRITRLLADALALHEAHGDGDCPVCGRAEALTPKWRSEAAAQLERSRQLAAAAEQAHTAVKEARWAARSLLTPAPAILGQAEAVGVDATTLASAWSAWQQGASVDDPIALANHLEAGVSLLTAEFAKAREAAEAELSRREDRWRPIAERLATWLPAASEAVAAATAIKHLQAAQQWLAEAATGIRNDRFVPIADAALANWRQLRHDSNVDIAAVAFEGVGNRRHVQLDVTVDGIGSAAFGVMSQGELHALALSLFLPRATLPESPFRFVVIDDPVQSMDPAKVEGLARVFERTARQRQVVVFTHDDRLSAAVRRLGIDARIFEVARQPGSIVHLRTALDPVARYLDDAQALVSTDELPGQVAERVVPTFCRFALESAFTDLARRRLLNRGVRHTEVEERLVAARTLMQRAALAFFEDADRGGEVLGHLNRRFGPWSGTVLKQVKQGAHNRTERQLQNLVEDTRRLAVQVQSQ